MHLDVCELCNLSGNLAFRCLFAVSVSLILVVFQQKMVAILEVSVVRFKRVFDIRWLSLGNYVAALIRNYERLMVVLEESTAAGDATAIGKSALRLRNSERVTEKYDCMSAAVSPLIYGHCLIQGPVHPSFGRVECKCGRVYPSNHWLWTGKTRPT